VTTEDDAERVHRTASPATDGDEHDPGEGDDHARDHRPRKAVVEHDPGDDGDQDRRDVHQQRRGAGVEVLFGPVEYHRVRREPREAVAEHEGQGAAAWKWPAVPQSHQRECGRADEQPHEGHRPGREHRADRADHHEGAGPEQHGDHSGGSSQVLTRHVCDGAGSET